MTYMYQTQYEHRKMLSKEQCHSLIEFSNLSNPTCPITYNTFRISYTHESLKPPYHEPMKVEKYSAEFVHKEDGTIVIDERTL